MLTAGIEFLHVNHMCTLFLTCGSSGIGIISRLLKMISSTRLMSFVDKRCVWFSNPKIRCKFIVKY